MTRKCWVLAAGLLVTLISSMGAQETTKPDPPGTTVFLSRYRAWFNLADVDKDGYLDKEELAKAFRGPKAKPFDYVPPPKETKDKDAKDKDDKDKDAKDKDDKDKDKNEKDKADKDKDAKDKNEKDKGDKDKGDKDKGDKAKAEKDKADKDKSEKGSDTEKPEKPEKTTPKKDYSRYPDYMFLIQLDKDGDEKISREEFESWAVDLAVQVKNAIETQQRLLALQQQLNQPNLKPADTKKYKAQLTKEQKQLQKLQQQMQKLQQNYQQANRPQRKN